MDKKEETPKVIFTGKVVVEVRPVAEPISSTTGE